MVTLHLTYGQITRPSQIYWVVNPKDTIMYSTHGLAVSRVGYVHTPKTFNVWQEDI